MAIPYQDFKVSVIIPAFNDEKFIFYTLESVIKQTHKNLEIIVIDDCSRDDTCKIVESFKDKRIVLLKNKKNRGAAYSRNLGIKKATGEYIAFLDGDDVWALNKVECQLKFMIDNNYSFSCTDYSLINEFGEDLNIRISGPNRITHRKFIRLNYAGCLTVMYKRSIYPDLSIPADIKKRNDYALWLKLSEKNDCYFLHEDLAKYRKRSHSISSGKKIGLLSYHRLVFQKIYHMGLIRATYHSLINGFFNVFKRFRYTKHTSINKEKEYKKNKFLSSLIFVFVNSFAISFFFITGSKVSHSSLEAKYIQAYNFSKDSDNCHINITANPKMEFNYKDLDTICRNHYNVRQHLHPYIKMDRNTKIGFEENYYSATFCSSPFYNDFEYTEYLNLPLYRKFSIKNGPLYGAKYAAYIPSSMADEILTDLNLLSYDQIFEIKTPFSVKLNNTEFLFSINNIYLNNETTNWKNKEEIEDQYYKVFSKNEQNAIFTYANPLFEAGGKNSLNFDIKTNYYFIKNSIESSLNTNADFVEVKCYKDNSEFISNVFYQNEKTINYGESYMVVLYICFGIMVCLDVFMLISFSELRKNLIIPVVVVTVLSALFMTVGEILKTIYSTATWPFIFFNYFGAVLSILFIINLFLVAVIFMKDKQNA